MSARLELEQIPYFSWKGKTLNQVTSSFKKNTYTLSNGDNNNIFLATPIKLYRKEIASQSVSGNKRISASVDEMNRPNGYIIDKSLSTSNETCTGIENTVDINLPNSKYDTGYAIEISTNPTDPIKCFSVPDNAKRRCRSGGAAIKQYDITNRKKNYYTSNQQYLYDRNETYTQNLSKTKYNDTSSDCLECPKPIVNPSNPRFFTQGGVSGSDYIARVRYEQITNAASQTANAYGHETANALAYNVNDSVYTNKDKVGYRETLTPVINKNSETMTRCLTKKISHAT
jgi:hypothetical protein